MLHYKQRIESITLIAAEDGEFDIRLDGKMVYSKLKTNVFPQNQEIIDLIDERL